MHAVAYSASPGTYILTGSADRAVRLYNPAGGAAGGEGRPAQGRLIQTFAAHGHEVLSVDVAGDNERFASAGGDRAVFLWDVATAATTRRFGGGEHGHTARVNCVRFAGAGDALVVSGGFDTTTRLWDTRAGGGGGARPVQVLTGARDAVTAVAARGADVVTTSVDGRVRRYDVRMGRCTTDVVGAPATSLALTRDGRAALVGSLDSRLRLLDRDTGACLRTYAAPGFANAALRIQSLLGGGERFVVAGDEMGAAAAAADPHDHHGGDGDGTGRIWAWHLLTGEVAATVDVPWGLDGGGPTRKRAVGSDGRARPRTNVVSCMAWRDGGWGDQFCVGGTSGVVTVFGAP